MDIEKVRLKFYLPPELYHQLEFQAAVESGSMSKIVERALAYLLGKADKTELSESEKDRIYTCLDYEKLLKINPKDYKAWYCCGVILKNLERYEEAIISFEKALEIKPDYNKAWYSRGNALYGLDFYEEAIVSYEKALKIEPRDYVAWYNRGNALSDLGLYNEAIESYDKALTIQPSCYQAWLAQGNALYHLGKYNQALFSYDKVLAIKPDESHAAYSRTIVQQKLHSSRSKIMYSASKEMRGQGAENTKSSGGKGVDLIAPQKSGFNEERPKVTLYLSPELHRQLKVRAAIDSEPMSSIAERAIIFYLTQPKVTEEVEAKYGQSYRVYSVPELSGSVVWTEEEEEELIVEKVSIKETASDQTSDSVFGGITENSVIAS